MLNCHLLWKDSKDQHERIIENVFETTYLLPVINSVSKWDIWTHKHYWLWIDCNSSTSDKWKRKQCDVAIQIKLKWNEMQFYSVPNSKQGIFTAGYVLQCGKPAEGAYSQEISFSVAFRMKDEFWRKWEGIRLTGLSKRMTCFQRLLRQMSPL